MSIEISDIYVGVVRVSCVVFPVYSGSSMEIILSILEISGKFNVCGIFNVSMHMCTIKNKMAEGFLDTKVFKNARTDTRAQL